MRKITSHTFYFKRMFISQLKEEGADMKVCVSFSWSQKSESLSKTKDAMRNYRTG